MHTTYNIVKSKLARYSTHDNLLKIMNSELKCDYQNKGYVLIENLLSRTQVITLINALKALNQPIQPYGVRDLMRKLPSIKALATQSPLLNIAQDILGKNAKAVRSVFFDKIPGANWNVAWHQDTSIAVSGKDDIEGFKLWSEKQGIIHVQPPEDYLESMLTLRLHLDEANSENGALRVIPGSHKNGRMNATQIAALIENSKIYECHANAGDVLLMTPLLLHSSRKAVKATHRRIIHLEYSTMELPQPLTWYES